MLTKEKFTKEFDGASSSYSNFLVIKSSIDDVLACLNNYDPDIDALGAIEKDGNVSFQVFSELPDLIFRITENLHTRGYADTDWDVNYFEAAENGNCYKDFTAKWVYDCPQYRDDDCWDAFVDITDPTGVVFHTGAGAVNDEDMEYYKDLVNSR